MVNVSCLMAEVPRNQKMLLEGFIILSFFQNGSDGVIVFIGNTDKEMNWTTAIPEGNKFSEVGVQIANRNSISIIQYTETRYKILNEGYTYHSFQCSLVSNIEYGPIESNDTLISTFISIIAPKNVLIQTEEPSLNPMKKKCPEYVIENI